MNKWQEVYSKLKEKQSEIKRGCFISAWIFMLIIDVLLMLVEDKLHE